MAFYVKLTADRYAILKKISTNRVFVQKGWVAAEKIARGKYESSRKIFFRDFLSHPVTKEIKGGVGARNTSGLLGGEQNLFSFFGFSEGEDPIGDVNLYLHRSFNFNRGSYRGKRWGFWISFPDEDQIAQHVVGKYGATYTSESWIEGVEKGYSGLNYYLRYEGKGRSRGGIQVKTPVRELAFSTTKYFSKIVSNFKKNIQ